MRPDGSWSARFARTCGRKLILTGDSFANAIVALHAIGGSTNAVIHLAAMAGRAGVPFALEDVGRLGATVPVLADVEPSGAGLMADFDRAGGVPTLLRELVGHLKTGAVTVAGNCIGDVIDAAAPASGAIRPASAPLREGGAFGVVFGSLAPDGAVIKTSAATPDLLRHRGPAVVFTGYEDMLARVDDSSLLITPDSVLVLTGCGPVGVPGMPEWGMIPIPARLVRAGVQRHGPGHRLPYERHQLRHSRAAHRAGRRRRRSAGPRSRR